MPKPLTNREKAIALFEPDDEGFSDWVYVSKLPEAGLNWGNNGNMRRGVAMGIASIKWEARRLGGPRSKVMALRMVGWNEDEVFDQSIGADVRIQFNNVHFCNLSQVRVNKHDREIDHRYGFKEHPDYVAVYSAANQSPDHFQLIHRALNQQKRQMCIECVNKGERPPHPSLGFAVGDGTLTERFPCKGCYLAEPELYRSIVTEGG
jgi:hypothetical protein